MGKRQKVNHDDILEDFNLGGGGDENVFETKMKEVVSSNSGEGSKVTAAAVVNEVKEESAVSKNETNGGEKGASKVNAPVVVVNPPASQPVVRKVEEETSSSLEESQVRVDENLYTKPVTKVNREDGVLNEVAHLIVAAMTDTERNLPNNIYMSGDTMEKMEKIRKALAFQKNIGKKAKLPLVQKILVDFFWENFGEDVKRRVIRGEREIDKRVADL